MQISRNRIIPEKKGLDCYLHPSGLEVVGLTGLEPVTPALSRRCSNQLSYRPAGHQEHVAHQKRLVEACGFEPQTLCLQSRCSTN